MRTVRFLLTKASLAVQSFVIFVLFVPTAFVAFVGAQTRPDFSGTWQCTSRNVGYPLVIQQTHDELIVETRSLPQGPPTETFRLDGERKTTVFEESGYWRRYDTTSHWDRDAFVGIVQAKAGWSKDRSPGNADMTLPHTICTRTLQLGPNRDTLTIRTVCTSPEQGDGTSQHMADDDHFARVHR
jgi:hypothetical protein